MDPATNSYVILLTNVVHPKRGKSLSSFLQPHDHHRRGLLECRRRPAPTGVLTGLDVLEQQNFAPLKGKHIGLITNQTGLDRDGRRNTSTP